MAFRRRFSKIIHHIAIQKINKWNLSTEYTLHFDISPIIIREARNTEIKESTSQKKPPKITSICRFFSRTIRHGTDLLNLKGLQHTVLFFYNSYVLKSIFRFIDLYVKGSLKIHRTINANRELHVLKSQKYDLLKFSEMSPLVSIEEIGLKKEGNEKIYFDIINSPEYILGEFDQDGYVLPSSELIYTIPVIDKEHFLPRKKFKIFLVSVYGRLGVKKDYQGNTNPFLNELKVYSRLSGKNINIPSIIDVNFNLLSITVSYIRGPTIRERLYHIGAVIFDHDVQANPELNKIPNNNRWLIQTKNKSESLYRVIDSQFIENLWNEIKKIHDCDIYLNDLKYGNIIIETLSNKPYFIDFEISRDLSAFGKYIKKIQKDQEMELFNNLFFTPKNDLIFEKQG